MLLRPLLAAASLTALWATAAHADNLAIGVVAPLKGNYALLGKQVVDGSAFQAARHGNRVTVVADSCEAADGPGIADALIAAKVSVATGFLCTESLEAALPKLKEAGIPAITLGVRSQVLMDDALKAGWPLFQLAPSQAAETGKLADIIGTTWSAEPFALIDDGAIGNRDLSENLRAALEEHGVKPVLTETLHPGQDQQLTLVRHLASAGVLRAFVAADRDDIAVLSRDLAEQALPITLLAGASVDTTEGSIPLAPGVQVLTLKDPAAEPGNAELVKALRVKGIEPEGYVMPAIIAQDVADQAIVAAISEKKPVAAQLVGRAFDTPGGPVRFNDGHGLSENPYRLTQWNGKAFVPTEDN